MNWVRYWSRAHLGTDGKPSRQGPAVALGWSDESPEAAHEHAVSRAKRLAAQLHEIFVENVDDDDGIGAPIRSEHYYCSSDRPLREPEVERFESKGELTAVITRNNYGCYVLNAQDVMFIDIDEPRAPSRPGLLKRLFFGARPQAGGPEVMDQVRDVVAARPGLGLRLYRTCAGYRGVVTSGTYDPKGDAARSLLRALKSDPLYVRLCERQDCFRARLSAKPWRIGMPSPQTRYYPWDDDPARKACFEDWSAKYEVACQSTSVCMEVARFGPETVHPAVQRLLEVHDRWCCSGTGSLA
ncbi:MAG: hypothetical protein ACYS22_09915 [Planctomycetota bacterium]|jgi:hypothetical protein